jgi:hypothetical protein
MGLDTKIYWLIDRQSQCDFDFDFDVHLQTWISTAKRVRKSRREPANTKSQRIVKPEGSTVRS